LQDLSTAGRRLADQPPVAEAQHDPPASRQRHVPADVALTCLLASVESGPVKLDGHLEFRDRDVEVDRAE
jgi:hypothetical protein